MICLSLKELLLQTQGFINVQLVIFMWHLVDNKILCLIRLITWISKSQQHQTAITFISNFTEQEETQTDKIGKEETLFKFVFLLLTPFSTKKLGRLNIKVVMDFRCLNMCPNGLVIKLFQMHSSMVLSLKFMEDFQDLH